MIDRARLTPPVFGMRRQIDRIVGDAFSRESRDRRRIEWAPVTRVHDAIDELVLTFELPGVALSDVEITAKNDVLIVRGDRHDTHADHDEPVRLPVAERRFQSFSRWFQLPAGVDDDMIESHFDGEVLTVRVSKHCAPPPPLHVLDDADAVMPGAGTSTDM